MLFIGANLPAGAQDYPKRTTIRIIVPQAVGSATDTIGRLLAQRISAQLGQQMIVDNRPGAGGLLGTEIASKSPADGYTLIPSWFGLAAPASTPRPVVGWLDAAMRKAPSDPEAIKQLANAGPEPAITSPDEFGAYIRSEIEKWTKVAKAANVKLD
jgi:tripartite-type tricarboxylate transporter receptor subunit TctC